MNFKKYLSEVTKDQLSSIGAEINAATKGNLENFPFNDIFGNKLRISIPLNQMEKLTFEKTMNDLGYSIDFKKGTAKSKIKDQDKDREERIGSVLQKLFKKTNDNKYKELLSWWEKSRPGFINPDKTGISVIISRSPIDILRMSDHKEWDSCHSPPGNKNNKRLNSSFWHCAIAEAKSGGCVAYIVKNSDLENVKNLQSKDIFKDKDREIQGIEPLERIRLRRFSTKNIDFLVPELRTYGIKHVGFEDTIKQWAKLVQKDKINFNSPPEMKFINLHGGSYQDNDASDLLNKFFDTDKYYGAKKSVDQESEDELNNKNMGERAEELLRGHTYKHFQVTLDFYEVLSYRGYVSFGFPNYIFKEFPTEKDLNINFSKNTPQSLGAEIKNALDIYTIEAIELHKHADKIYFNISFYDEEDNNTLDRFEHFLDEVDDYDKNYDKEYIKILNLLKEKEYIEDKKINFNHFEYSDDGVYESDEIWIGYLKGINRNHILFYDRLSFDDKRIETRSNWIFNDLVPFSYIKWLYKDDLSSAIRISDNNIIKQPIKVLIKLEIPTTPKNFYQMSKTVKFIDDNWDFFTKKAIHYWEIVYKKLTSEKDIEFPYPDFMKSPAKSQQMSFPFHQKPEKPFEPEKIGESFLNFIKNRNLISPIY